MTDQPRRFPHSPDELAALAADAIAVFDALEILLADERRYLKARAYDTVQTMRTAKEEKMLELQTKLSVLLSYRDALDQLPQSVRAELRDRHVRFHAAAGETMAMLDRMQRVFKKFQGRLLDAARSSVKTQALRYDAHAQLDSTKRRVVSTGILATA